MGSPQHALPVAASRSKTVTSFLQALVVIVILLPHLCFCQSSPTDSLTSSSSAASFFYSASSSSSSIAVPTSSPGATVLQCGQGCLHNGTCKLDSTTNTPVCVCPSPDPLTGQYFRGAACQTEAIRCNATWWCENGGQCEFDFSLEEFSCACPLTFQGARCQTPVKWCGNGVWCANGGRCATSPTNSSLSICLCPSTHGGDNCQTALEDPDYSSSSMVINSTTSGGETSGMNASLLNSTSINYYADNGLSGVVEEERRKYFHIFFFMLAVLLVIWAVAFALVQRPWMDRPPPRVLSASKLPVSQPGSAKKASPRACCMKPLHEAPAAAGEWVEVDLESRSTTPCFMALPHEGGCMDRADRQEGNRGGQSMK